MGYGQDEEVEPINVMHAVISTDIKVMQFFEYSEEEWLSLSRMERRQQRRAFTLINKK